MEKKRTPWIYIPTLYFAEGVPYILVNAVSVVMYKKMGISNQLIGLTSILYFPWVVKMFWGPLVDIYSTKRNWIIYSQLAMFISITLVAFGIHLPSFFWITLVIFIIIAFVSATHDIAADGFYMLALDRKNQAFFVGVRATAYRIAMLFGTSVLVVIAGNIEKSTDNIPFSWLVAMSIAAAVFLFAFVFHRYYLPFPASDKPGATYQQKAPFIEIFRSYFKQDKIVPIVIFILIYRLGEAVLVKMAPPFYLDKPEVGGLGLATTTLGLVSGTGMISLTIGGLMGGWLISKFGLKKCIWPMAIMLKAPDLVYVYMSIAKPPLQIVYVLVGFEQFGYGIGFTAFMVFLMYIAREPYKTSHFAISTGIMALGMMIPGLVSGVLQAALGYVHFFILVICLTIPGMIILFFIPLENEQKQQVEDVSSLTS